MSGNDLTICAEPNVVSWLTSGRAFGTPGPVERIDTHAASIFLHGDRAWKIKRRVSLGYLDFSKAAGRKAALQAELDLNRRTAPDLYIALHAIVCDVRGGLELDGAGVPVDWVLEMRRFPDGALLGKALQQGGIDDRILSELADSIVAFHKNAAVRHETDGAMRLRRVVEGNTAQMARYPDILPSGRVAALNEALLAAVAGQAALLDARASKGRVRHGHGDLHLANIALIEGRAVPFDCLEFDEELATGDVLYDLAFLVMDLWGHAHWQEANLVFNRYLDRSGVDEGAEALMPLFMAVRASVRAHVLAAQWHLDRSTGRARSKALDYLALAERLMRQEPVRLVAVGGLSGSGKSTLARFLGWAVGHPPGARILRSDILRKRLEGIAPEARLPSDSYTQAASDRVYDELNRLIEQALSLRQSVIADAMFVRPEERSRIAMIAHRLGCAFDGLWLRVDTQERLKRVAERRSDASDADGNVVQSQADIQEGPLGEWVNLEASDTLDGLGSVAAIVLNLPWEGARPHRGHEGVEL